MVKPEVATKADIRELELKFEARMSENKAELVRWIVCSGRLQQLLRFMRTGFQSCIAGPTGHGALLCHHAFRLCGDLLEYHL